MVVVAVGLLMNMLEHYCYFNKFNILTILLVPLISLMIAITRPCW